MLLRFVVPALALAFVAAASAGSSARPLPGTPAYTAGYKTWFKLNAKPIPPRTGGDAHLGSKNIYASKRRNPRTKLFPVGTVIVKEASRPGKKFVGLIAVMRKLPGKRPNNGWEFIEYTRETATGRFSELARGAICTSCHVGSRRTDYVCFLNGARCP